MRLRTFKYWLMTFVVIAVGVWAFGMIRAQEEGSTEGEVAVEAPIPREQNIFGLAVNGDPNQSFLVINDKVAIANAGESIRRAAQAIRDAQGDGAKAAAEKGLLQLLDTVFDADMTRREAELKKVEERLVKLRDLLNRRRAKKQEILELQVKVALNEAEGLGFYDGQPQGPWQTEFDWQQVPTPSIVAAPGPIVTGRTITGPLPTASVPVQETVPTEPTDRQPR